MRMAISDTSGHQDILLTRKKLEMIQRKSGSRVLVVWKAEDVFVTTKTSLFFKTAKSKR